MRPFTAVIREVSSPRPPAYSRPLIMVVEIEDHFLKDCTLFNPTERFREEVLRQCAIGRFEDIEGGEPDAAMIEDITEGLVIDFVFEGDINPSFDFRT